MKPGFFLRACLLIVLVFGSVPIHVQAQPASTLNAVNCASQTEIPPAECLALVAFYNSTSGPGWINSTGWLATNTPCAWYGVSCGYGHVVNLNIGNNNLSGPIPPEIANLPWLDGIHLAGNQLSGSIPPQIGSLSRLEDFYLAGNALSGSIPLELTTLPSLITLTLPNNQLTGSIPAQLGNMAHLSAINLANNRISGSIPVELANLDTLSVLDLSGNQLTGTIPPQLGNLDQLVYLRLNSNQLSGTIPAALGGLPALRDLNLGSNQLSGAIPPQLGNLAQLKTLSLAFNFQLGGSIPPELGNLTQLQTLSLYSCNLSGGIPAWLSNLTQLLSLDLSYNPLGGSIPVELASLTSLQILNLRYNQLTGSIPAQLGNMVQLGDLNLRGNQLTGGIPPSLGNLNQLMYLYLADNQLSGSIPPELGNLSTLRALELGRNQLSGNIPAQLGNLPQLWVLSLEWNQLSGSIPVQLGSLSQLMRLNLSANQLSGSVPAGLGNLSQLYSLDLASNQFSGSIPAELGNLSQLNYLFLGDNQLSGGIPVQLTNLSQLVVLYLNNNQLSGAVPVELGSMPQLGTLYLNSNPLGGPLPAALSNLGLDKFYFDNTQLCEPEDGAFQAWLGNIPNLGRTNVVCSEKTIILLPGIMGSRLTNSPANSDCADDFFRTFGEVWFKLENILGLGTLVLKPDGQTPADGCNVIKAEGIMDETGMIDAYSAFMNDAQLKAAGYTIKAFPYDWRLSLDDSAAKLDAQIAQWRYSKVILVGHSMGGLLARRYVSSHADKVSQVITVGTPYWGAPTISLNMRGGWLPQDFRVAGYSVGMPVVADIIRNSPGSMQLLPSSKYFEKTNGYYMNDTELLSTYAATKNFFTTTTGKQGKQNGPLIDAAAAFHTTYDDLSMINVDYHILVGEHLATKSVVREYSCSFMLIPDTCFEYMSFLMGDDTVPNVSARAGLVANVATTNPRVIPFGAGELSSTHGDLMKDPAILSAIRNILAGDPPKSPALKALAALEAPAPYLQVSVLGGAEVGVTDASGHFSGIEAGGAIVNEIPGATYDVFGVQTEIILPAGQVYTVALKQTSGYPLAMKVSELRAPTTEDAFTPYQRAVFVDIPASLDGVATLPLDLSAGLDTLALALDQDNDGTVDQTLPPTSILDAQQVQDVTMPVTTINIHESPGADGYYTGTVTAALSASDSGAGVFKTEYSLDGGRTWQAYQTPVSIAAEDGRVLYARSVDQAGNYEYPWRSLRLRPETVFLPMLGR